MPGGAAAVATVVLPGDGAALVDVTGPADAVTGVPATPCTPFHLCSMAKTMAAVVVLRLAARGVLGLHDDVRTLVPVEVRGRTGPTLWQLLAHRGGVVDPPGSFEPTAGPVAATRDVVDGLTDAHPARVRVTHEPGSAFSYSDAGYCLVERAVEVATGEAFADVAHREVVVPLGLAATGYWGGEPAVDGPRHTVVDLLARDAASGHHADGTRVAGGRAHYAGLAASSLWSSPADVAVLLADLGRALAGDDGVLLDAAQGAVLRHDPDDVGAGPGTFLLGTDERPCVMTQGWGLGFQGQVRWYPREQGAVAVLVNCEPGVPQVESLVGMRPSQIAVAHGWA
nr:serine hydrolase domain-containing protein [Cellulomonas phragmiteti]